MKEAKLTIEEISKNFVSYWILLLAAFLKNVIHLL